MRAKACTNSYMIIILIPYSTQRRPTARGRSFFVRRERGRQNFRLTGVMHYCRLHHQRPVRIHSSQDCRHINIIIDFIAGYHHLSQQIIYPRVIEIKSFCNSLIGYFPIYYISSTFDLAVVLHRVFPAFVCNLQSIWKRHIG